tara:strand:+ start:1169 stop:1813 length:645 start_codon:yes stop_codon:yes gene_type:complete
MLQYLPYALAAYGGYRGYRQAKDSGASGLGRLAGAGIGAAAGYYGGKGILKGGEALGIKGFASGAEKFTPFSKLPFIQNVPYIGTESTKEFPNLLTRQRVENGKIIKGEREIDPMRAGIGLAALTYASGAFDPQDIDIFTPTYNLGVADLAANRPGMKYIDPVTGEEKFYDRVYIPESDPKNRGDAQMGNIAIERTTFKARTGGLAARSATPKL